MFGGKGTLVDRLWIVYQKQEQNRNRKELSKKIKTRTFSAYFFCLHIQMI